MNARCLPALLLTLCLAGIPSERASEAFAESPTPSGPLIASSDAPALSFEFPASLNVTEGSQIAVTVHASEAPSQNLTIPLSVSSLEVTIPPSLTLGAGSTTMRFNLLVKDNDLLDGNRLFVLETKVAGWANALEEVQIIDNEKPALFISLPTPLTEGSGTLTNMGRITLGGKLTTNLTVQLASSLPSRLKVTNQVIVPARTRTATFDIALPDNSAFDGEAEVEISADGGLLRADTFVVTVLDNDVHHLIISSIPSPQHTGVAFTTTIEAVTIDGDVVTQFNEGLVLDASSPNGAVFLSVPASPTFKQGRWTGALAIPTPEGDVRIKAASGDLSVMSDPFDVYFFSLSGIVLPARALAFYPPTGKILASAGRTDATNYNAILEVDPQNAQITGRIANNINAGRLEFSSDFTYLYTVTDKNLGVTRIKMADGTAQSFTSFGKDNDGHPYAVVDVAAPGPRNLDYAVSLVSDQAQGVIQLRSGPSPAPAQVPTFGGALLRRGHIPGMLYGLAPTIPSSFYTMESSSNGIVAHNFASQLIKGFDGDFELGDDIIYSNKGEIADADTLAILRTFTGREFLYTPQIRFDPQTGRVCYLKRGDTLPWALSVYDKLGLALRGSIPLPSLAGKPIGLARFGADGLAVATTSNQVLFVRSEMIGSDKRSLLHPEFHLPASIFMVGETNAITITVTNEGSSEAHRVETALYLPAGVAVPANVISAAELGSLVPISDGYIWKIPSLPPGTLTATIHLRTSIPGKLKLRVQTQSRESAGDPARNSASVIIDSRFDYGPEKLASIPLSAADLAYDPFRDRIYASIPAMGGPLHDKIVVIDPASAELDGDFLPGNTGPEKLAISADGRFLYCSVNGGREVNRIDLDTKVSKAFCSMESGLFIEDMLVLTTKNDTVAISRSTRTGATQVHPITVLYQNGQPLPQTTPGQTGTRLQINEKGDILFTSGMGAPLQAYSITPAGLVLLQESAWFRDDFDAQYDSGFLYAADGHILSASSFESVDMLTAPGWDAQYGLGHAGRVRPNAGESRLYFLSPSALFTFDLPTRSLIRSNSLAGFRASYPPFTGDLINAGKTRLAFHDNAAVYLMQDAASAETVDLQIEQTAPDLLSIDSPADVSITVINASTRTAHEVIVADHLPPNISFISGEVASGTISVAGQIVSAHIPSLEAGAKLTVLLRVLPKRAAPGVNLVTAAAFESDLAPENNSASKDMPVRINPVLDVPQLLDLLVYDMIYNPKDGLLYVSIPRDSSFRPNTITAVNPNTGEIGVSYPVGDIHVWSEIAIAPGEQGQLALSDAGTDLYVIENEGAAFRHVNLETGEVAAAVSLGNARNGSQLKASHIEVLPGTRDQIAVGRYGNTTVYPVAIYDQGVLGPMGPLYGRDFKFLADGLEFFGMAFSNATYERRQGENWEVAAQVILPSAYYSPIAAAGHNLLLASGHLIEPETLDTLARFPTLVYSYPVADGAKNRALFLPVLSFSPLKIEVCHLPSLLPVGEATVEGYFGTIVKMVRFGEKGIAFAGSKGEICLLRSSLLPSGPVVDIRGAIQLSTTNCIAGEIVPLACLAENTGTLDATNVSFTLALPQGASIESSSQEFARTAVSNNITFTWPKVAAGKTAQIDLSFRMPDAGRFTIRGAAWCNAILDPDAKNDFSSKSLVVSPPSDSPTEIHLNTRNIVYSPLSRELLLAMVTDGAGRDSAVFALDPITRRFTRGTPTREDPYQLKLTEDGKWLYLATRTTLQRFALPLLASAGFTQVGQDDQGPDGIVNFSFRPGTDEVVSVTGQGKLAWFKGIDLFKKFYFGPYYPIEFLSSNVFAVLGSSRNERYELAESGVTNLGSTAQPANPFNNVLLSGQRLYFSDGTILSTATLEAVGHFANVAPRSIIGLDAGNQRAFFSAVGSPTQVRVYNLATTDLLNTYALPTAQGDILGITRWAADGLALLTEAQQLFLLRLPEIPVSDANDTDGDGMPDLWERNNGLDPNDPSDAVLDADADGFSNRNEFIAGTNPNDASSLLKLSTRLNIDQLEISWAAPPRGQWLLQSANAIDGGAGWATVWTAAPPYKATATDTRFYRLVAQ